MSFLGANSLTTTAKTTGLFSSFGASNTATTTNAGFGAPNVGGGSNLNAFGGFGSNPVAAVQPVSTFSGFGTNTAQTGSTLFGGAAAPNPSVNTNFGGFGASTTNTANFGGFNAATSATPGFGTGFGGAFNTSGTTFGSNFGKMPTTTVTPGFGGFGGNTNFMLGQPQQQQMPQISPDEAFAQSIFNVTIYGDERDAIIAKWNYLQAMWGTGKSFYSQVAPPVDITPQNYLSRFKAISYSRMPGKENKMGLVGLNINKSQSELQAQERQIVGTLNMILGNKPNLNITIESSKTYEDKKSQLVIYVEEKSPLPSNEVKRIMATELAGFLNQPTVKAQLNSCGIVDAVPLVLPDEDQIKEYLENPPKGIDSRMWHQAKYDNPDVSKFIPVPMMGFNDLKWRIKCQEAETETHARYLKKVEEDLAELRQRHACATSKILEHKRKLAELSHTILKIIVKQECTRKVGSALTPEEENLRTKLENMQALVSAPTQFKGRLSELLSQMRMQRNQYALTGNSDYMIDKDCEDEMVQFLAMQQKAMEVLSDTVTKDLKALNIIINDMPDVVRG